MCLCAQVLNKLDEFEDAVRKAMSDVRLDNDVVVSVFETNIRVLGYDIIQTFFFSVYTAQHLLLDRTPMLIVSLANQACILKNSTSVCSYQWAFGRPHNG